MALLFADECFSMPSVEVLRQLGHDVQTLLQLGQAGLAILDDEVLQLSTSLNRCLLPKPGLVISATTNWLSW